MRVEELIIDGFKSYATRTVVAHWDPQFNAITGLNGSGKSNILDAICFVLGIASMATVRASNLQDLIYKRGQAGVTKASVTIVFNNSQKETSPIGFENVSKISVTRQVTLGGVSKYLINGHRAQQQSVLQLFQSVQLNINNPNFLIMQGKITKVLNMKPKEILALIEEAAGTKMFEDRRQKAEKTMAKKDAKLAEIKDILSEEVEPKLRRFQQDKEVYLQFQDIQSQMEELQQLVVAHDYTVSKYQFSVNNQKVDDEKNVLKALEIANQKLIDELKGLNAAFKEVEEKRDESNKVLNLNLKEHTKKLSELKKNMSRLDASHDIHNKNLQSSIKKIEKLELNNQKISGDLIKKKDTLNAENSNFAQLNDQLSRLNSSLSNNKELLMSLKNSGSNAAGYSAQIAKFKKNIADHALDIKRNDMKIQSNQMEITKNIDQIQQSETLTQSMEKQLNVFLLEKESLATKISQFSYDKNIHQSLNVKSENLNQESRKLQKEIESLKRKFYNLDFHYDKETVSFDPSAVKGIAATLFDIESKNMDKAQALQVCAGGRLFNVVVENEKIGSELLEKGNLKKRITIIPLNKIAARKLKEDIVKIAKDVSGDPGKVNLALDLIGYEPEVSKAMEFIFGSSLICENADVAKKVTFHPKIRARSITLDGDVYDPEGTLSGGSRNNSSNLLLETQNFNRLLKKQKVLDMELKSLVQQSQQYEATRIKISPMLHELTLLENKISQLQKELKNSVSNVLVDSNIELEKEILELKESNQKLETLIDQLQTDIKKIDADSNSFKKNKEGTLVKLENTIKELVDEIKGHETKIERVSDSIEDLQVEFDQLEDDLNSNKETIKKTKESVEETKSLLESLNKEVSFTKEEIEKFNALQNSTNEANDKINEEFRKLSALIKTKKTDLEQMPDRLKNSKNTIKSLLEANGELDSYITDLAEEFEWLEKDPSKVVQLISSSENLNLVEAKDRLAKLKDTFNSLKNKVNPNVVSMIESVLKRETDLRTMIKTIEDDKKKIQDTIETLNQHKIDTLLETHQKVTVDFGSIFKELLPNSFAKLVLLPGKPITDGLEVKVKLGSIWKESLVELSGGQRSLVALSLILALLQFKPAPMYILDEVDAALDLSHTQNIGHLIKTKFKGSQFIIVSLKEGMFNNANRVFRTRFQDGTSTVSIMT